MQDNYDLYMREHQQEMIDALRTLVKHPSVRGVSSQNAPFGKPTADVLHAYLDLAESYGFHVKNYDNFAGTAEYGDHVELGILSHLDVVPTGNGWTFPPFDVTEQDGFLYGRGVIDDKGPTIAALFALRAIKDMQIPLKKGVRLIVGCAEETDQEDMDYYTDKESFPPMLFTPDADFPLINIEKGRVHATLSSYLSLTAAPCTVLAIEAGEVVNAVPDKATATLRGFSTQDVKNVIDHLGTHGLSFEFEEKESLLHITVHGKSAHASTPETGVNALTGLLMILNALPLDGCDSADTIKALATLFPFKETDGSHAGVACEDEKSGALTLALTCLKMDDDECIGHLDIRFPLCTTKDDVIYKLRELGEQHHFEVSCTGAEPHYVSENSDFVQTLLRTYTEVTGEPALPISTGGGTYVHGTENGVAFGAEFPGDDNHMHGADERIEIEKWIQTAVIYAHAIENLCT